MPIHDWSIVPAGMFHHFHQDWTVDIARSLNRGRLPKEFSAMVEQRAGTREGDVLTIESHSATTEGGGGVLTLERPAATIVRKSSNEIFADRANRVAVRHHLGRIVAIIEVLSPGNKDSRAALRDFVAKTIDFMRRGVHLLLVDLFPPTARDPFGIHKAVWDEIQEEDFHFPPNKDRIAASYEMGVERVAYVEPLAVGDFLPEMPLFLSAGVHVRVPLEASYRVAWDASPEAMRTAVETGVFPDVSE